MAGAAGKCCSLPELPPEVLLHIFSFLDMKTLLLKVELASRRFHQLLTNETLWKIRLSRRFRGIEFPDSFRSSDDFSYCKVVAALEEEHGRWSGCEDTKPDRTLSDGHFATVDAVRLLDGGRLLLSGSRDRSLCLWDLSNTQPGGDCPLLKKDLAHDGWIWSITSGEGGSVYTGGWDSYVRHWQLAPTGLQEIGKSKCSSAVLGLVAEPDLVLAGVYDHRVVLLDPRTHYSPVAPPLDYHTGPVLGLATDGHYIWTCSEDKHVVCVDRRTWKRLAARRLPRHPMSLSFAHQQLWVSDSVGRLHLMDPQQLSLISTVSVAGSSKVRDVSHGLGFVACVSADKHLRVLLPGKQIKCLFKAGPLPGEPTRLDYSGGRMVCAYDQSIGVWNRSAIVH